MTIHRVAKTLAMGAVLASTFLTVSAFAESKARIVRLSDVEGTVQIDRNTGEGFEKAFLNLPVIEGSRLKTGKDGRAEVEFEDGSALRVGPDSELNFERLSLGDNGQKISTVELASGTAYGSFHDQKGNDFQLILAQQSLTVPSAAHFRVSLTGSSSASLAVFKGAVNANGPSGKFDVAEKHSATIDLAAVNAAKTDGDKSDAAKTDDSIIAKNYDQEPLDGWDRQQNDYHERFANTGGSSFSSPYGYGVSDLNYYGNFMMLPGYGSVWQPFFTNAGWSPFMDGAWSWYPGAGYTWVSAYPWGWMPYRYGNWAFIPPYGWVWEPGMWNSWYAVPRVKNPPPRTTIASAPVSGHKTVMVGMGLSANPVGTPRKLTINPGSAGFGVPRGSVRHLDQVAKTIERTSAPVTASTQPPPSNTGFGSGGGFGAGSSMRGGASRGASMAPPAHHSSAPSPRSH